MKTLLAASVLLVALGACGRRSDRTTETGSRLSSDTVVTNQTMKDTAIIRHDTNVSTDTVHKRGQKSLKTDTVHKP